jgi:hypothetical protein
MQFESNYSRLDRLLHRLAFATQRLQIDFAESEDRKFADLPLQPPRFITGLRRHGNFLKLHARDAFARTYMAGVDHFDFGALLAESLALMEELDVAADG